MHHHALAVIPGDGIGVEVVPEALRVLNRVNSTGVVNTIGGMVG